MAMRRDEIISFIDSPSILPEKSFMNWLREMMQERNFNGIKTKNLDIKFHYREKKEYKYVENAIRGNNNKYDTISLKREIGKWNPLTPVIISAPTGTGKNTFVLKILVKMLFKQYGYRKKVLLLSNRVALNRQNKLNFFDELYNLTRDNYFKENKENKTPKDLDDFIDFKIIWIVSYQQLYERNVEGKGIYINLNQFDYIICDEAHFFTSDATFNTHTDEILEYLVTYGKNAIRIYMTATIEVVFEVIIRNEMKDIEERIQQAEQYRNMQRPDEIDILNINQVYQFNVNNVSNEIMRLNNNIDLANEQFRARPENSLTVHFYYMNCDYDYLSIYSYKNEEELIPIIEKSNEKWLIFVSKLSDTDEKVTFNAIKDKKIINLSRRRVENREKTNEIYEKLIENEKFDEDVMITTSLVDNGINIKDENVKNIVIDGIFNSVEAKQMIGRVRIKKVAQINLYIREYDLKDLKKMLKRNVTDLERRLYIDLMTPEQQQNYYESMGDLPERYGKVSNKFRFSNLENQFCEYNKYVIPTLIEQSNCILKLIKREEPEYLVELDVDDMDTLKRLNAYYKKGAGIDKSWSRSLIDIIETLEGLEEREEAIYNECRHIPVNMTEIINKKYEFRFEDTFTKYFYGELIPKCFDKKINDRIESINSYRNNMFSKVIYVDNGLSSIEKLRIIKEHVKNTESIDISNEEEYYQKIEYYKDLSSRKTNNALEEQLKWLEKDTYTKISDFNKNNPQSKENINEYNESQVMIKIIDKETFNNGTEVKDGKCYCNNEKLWKEYGYKRESKEANYISDKYFGGNLLSRKPNACISGKKCQVKSIYRRKDKQVFYVLVELNDECDDLEDSNDVKEPDSSQKASEQ